MPEPSANEDEMASETIKRSKSPGTVQIPGELVKAVGITTPLRSTNLFILFGIRRNCLRSGRSRSLYLLIRRVIKTDDSNYRGISLLLTTYKCLSNILLSTLTPHAEEITGDHLCGFLCNRSITDHTFCIRQILAQFSGATAIYRLQAAYDPGGREILYNILIEFGIAMKLVRLINMCVNETDSKVRVGKHLCDMFPT